LLFAIGIGINVSFAGGVQAEDGNSPPILYPIGNQQGNEGEWFVIGSITATDLDNDTLTITPDSLPAGVRYFQTASGPGSVEYKLRWPDTQVKQGTYNIAFTASDGNGSTDSETITITITRPQNNPPILSTIGTKNVNEGETLIFKVEATDDPEDIPKLQFSANPIPYRASFNPATQMFTWTPDYRQARDYTVRFEVTDGELSDYEDVLIKVFNANGPPYFDPQIGYKEVGAGETLSFVVTATDPDPDDIPNLVYSALRLPDGANFNPAERQFTWTPTYEQVGFHPVRFEVTDGKLTGYEEITITVNDMTPPDKPTVDPITSPTDVDVQTITGTKSEDAAKIIVTCAQASMGEVSYPGSTTWSCTLTSMSMGENTVLVIAEDGYGNQTDPIAATIYYYPLAQVTDETSNEINPHVVMNGPTVYAVWADEDTESIYFARSPDGGLSWVGRKIIGNGNFARIARDQDGTLYAVMGMDHSRPISPIYFVKSTDGGNSFITPLEIEAGHNPDIAVSQHGEVIYLVWDISVSEKPVTLFTKSTDAGETFQTSIQVSDPAAALATHPQVLTMGYGNYVWVTYTRKFTPDNDGTPYRHKNMLTRSSDYGINFDTATQIAPEEHNSAHPNMIYCQDGTFYVVWRHDYYAYNHIYLRRSDDLGKTFQPLPGQLNFAADRIDDGDFYFTDCSTPTATSDRFGNIYIAFADSANGAINDIYFDKLTKENPKFGKDLRLDGATGSSSQEKPAIAVDAYGNNICVMWQDDRSGNYDIYCRIIKNTGPIDWLRGQISEYGFVDSYQDDGTSKAYTYDQGLAVMAFVKAGDFDSAKKVLEALRLQQNTDGSWHLCYDAITGENLDTANSKYVGTCAWVIMAINYYTAATSDASYISLAQNAASWIHSYIDTNPVSQTYGSATGGESDGQVLTWRSTEHNLTLYSAFKYLYQLCQENGEIPALDYIILANATGDYLINNMWDQNEERFWTGWEDQSEYLDVNSLAILSLGTQPNSLDITPALQWAYENLAVYDDVDNSIQRIHGFDENATTGLPLDKIWSEGTEQMVAAYRSSGNNILADHFHEQILRLQKANRSIPYATPNDDGWVQYPSVSATCWYYFNEGSFPLNPFNPYSTMFKFLFIDGFQDYQPNVNHLRWHTDDDDTCVIDEDTNGTHRITWDDLGDYWYSDLWDRDSVYTDGSPYRNLSFRIKGEQGGEKFMVRMKDGSKEVDLAITDYVNVTTSWQQVDIPLKDFVAEGLDTTRLRSVIFYFSVAPSGTIWIDDVKLHGFQHPPIL